MECLRILNPNAHSSVAVEPSRGNHVLGGVTADRDHGISVAFELLNHGFLLEIPNVNAFILRTAHNVFPIRHRERGSHAVGLVNVPGIVFQELLRRVVPELLHPQERKKNRSKHRA